MPLSSKQAFTKEALLSCKGYDAKFIDQKTSINFENILPASSRRLLPKVEGNKKGILHYTNLSVLYHKIRKVPIVTAYNIDGSVKSKNVKRASAFHADPRIPEKIQLSQQFYDLRTDITEFEIGHMAANNEMAWGDDAQLKSFQTFHFPNSVPQAEKLNSGIWKSLETYIINEAASITGNKRICVFTGPLLRKDDPGYIKDPQFRIPLLFYKVIVFNTTKGLYSTGFMMSHEAKMIEDKMLIPGPSGVRGVPKIKLFTDFKFKEVFQVSIPFMEEKTGLNFSWKGVKKVPVPLDKKQVTKIRKIKDAAGAEDMISGRRTRGDKIDTTPAGHHAETSFKLTMILP